MTLYTQKKTGCFLVVLLLYSGIVAAQKNVLLLPTMHKLHTVNIRYNYDSLRAAIAAFKPTTIAVEIRNEDLSRDTAYLKRNYPYEMWMIPYWFPGVSVVGFDWLGTDIENKQIPDDYWRTQAEIKNWERALDADTLWSVKIAPCDSFTQQRMRLLKTSTLNELLRSTDAKLTMDYYHCLDERLAGSIHHRVIDFYNARNTKMISKLKEISSHTGKNERLLILTGDDHYPILKQWLGEE